MKLGVLSDIHGNFEAFKACVDYLERRNVDGYVFLGDYIGDFPNPEMTLGLMHGLMNKKRCFVIRGNKEEYVLKGLGDGHPEWDEYKSVVGMLRYGFDHVSSRDKRFFESLPNTMAIKFEGLPALRLCHGAPYKTNGIIKDESEETFARINEEFILCGHTHKQSAVYKYGKKIWNPGSVGLPMNGEMTAQCMILYGENGTWRPDYLEVPYDIDAEIASMKREKLFDIAPFWSIVTLDVLKGGLVSHGAVLKYAMKLCEKDRGTCNWPEVPEKYMSRAVSDLVFLD